MPIPQKARPRRYNHSIPLSPPGTFNRLVRDAKEDERRCDLRIAVEFGFCDFAGQIGHTPVGAFDQFFAAVSGKKCMAKSLFDQGEGLPEADPAGCHASGSQVFVGQSRPRDARVVRAQSQRHAKL